MKNNCCLRCSVTSQTIKSASHFALAMALICAFMFGVSPVANAQSEKVLHSFGPQGVGPQSGVIVDSQGNLYGTASEGGSCQYCGTVYEITAAGKEITLHNFGGPNDGSGPIGGLIRDPQGNLYGTTFDGGPNNGQGIVFEITSSGVEKILFVFDGTDGAWPMASLIRDAQGNLYGTASQGGAQSVGTVFKIDSSGVESTLYNFQTISGDGQVPEGQLVMDASGNLYGTTHDGGSYQKGTVFEITPDRTETVLYSFTGGADGKAPGGNSSLLLDPKGNLYGVAAGGGVVNSNCPGGCGTVFEVTPGSGITVLYEFTGKPDGQNPVGGFIRDSKGNLYGATSAGGSQDNGTLYELSTSGNEKVLYNFPGHTGDGNEPFAGLTPDGKGGAYGTTLTGGKFDAGTVYHVTP